MQAVAVRGNWNPAELVTRLLSATRSEATKRAYAGDLRRFFGDVMGQAPEGALPAFLAMDRPAMTATVLEWRERMLADGLSEATVNRRLAAVKALVRLAYQVGIVGFTLEVQGQKAISYRDTTGIGVGEVRALLGTVERSTTKGKRDYAILVLLWENALRRQEVCGLDVGDIDGNRLWIRGKGRGTQKEAVTISPRAQEAIREYLGCFESEEVLPNQPLFMNEDRAQKGDGRLSGEAIRYVVNRYGKKAGIEKDLAPHMLRHSAITAALDATQGDVRKVGSPGIGNSKP